jgi:carotenoid cleavage dioxygenase
MRRRDFLKVAALGGFSVGFGGFADRLLAVDGWRAAYREGRHENPWAIGFRSVDTDYLNASLEVLQGRVPDGLRGTLYRNGPNRHELGGRRYHHWFDGDGMVQAFRFTESGARHQGRYVQTAKHRAESKAGRFLRPAFGTRFPDSKSVDNRDAVNTANTSVLTHQGRLMALWEGGSAYGMDGDDLTTNGPIAWSQETAGLPFSAHPSVEADGTLWNFGLSAVSGQLILYEIAPSGTLRRAETIALSDVPMIHDFVVTERYLVFLMPPFHFRRHRFVDQRHRGHI